MSSTNINIGLIESNRNSSRVLKPPGGAHSDIFGIHEPTEQKNPRAKNHAKSSISEVFAVNEPVNSNSTNQNEKKTEEQPITTTDNQNQNNVPVPNENEAPKPSTMTSQPQRTRVPPGGFSSGLW